MLVLAPQFSPPFHTDIQVIFNIALLGHMKT